MRLRSVEDLLRDERKLLAEIELFRAAIEAADAMRTDIDGKFSKRARSYDEARAALPDWEGK